MPSRRGAPTRKSESYIPMYHRSQIEPSDVRLTVFCHMHTGRLNSFFESATPMCAKHETVKRTSLGSFKPPDGCYLPRYISRRQKKFLDGTSGCTKLRGQKFWIVHRVGKLRKPGYCSKKKKTSYIPMFVCRVPARPTVSLHILSTPVWMVHRVGNFGQVYMGLETCARVEFSRGMVHRDVRQKTNCTSGWKGKNRNFLDRTYGCTGYRFVQIPIDTYQIPKINIPTLHRDVRLRNLTTFRRTAFRRTAFRRTAVKKFETYIPM